MVWHVLRSDVSRQNIAPKIFCLRAFKGRTIRWLPLEIMHRGHTWHDYPWPWVSLSWLLYNWSAARWRTRRWFRKFTVRFRPIRKEIVSSVNNNTCKQNYEQQVTTGMFQAQTRKLPVLVHHWAQNKAFLWHYTKRVCFHNNNYKVYCCVLRGTYRGGLSHGSRTEKTANQGSRLSKCHFPESRK